MKSDYSICVTGSTGYIGQHLVEALRNQGYSFCEIGRPGVPKGINPSRHELVWENVEELSKSIAALPNPVLINVAGHFVGQHKIHDIRTLLAGNIEFPLQMFEAFSRAGCKNILNIGTSWEYDSLGNRNPENLYAAMKFANSKILDWYSTQYSTNVLNLKLNDTYGRADNRKKLMPLLKEAYNNCTDLELGYRLQEINLLHVEDVCSGILAALNLLIEHPSKKLGDLFLMSDETLTLGELTELCNKTLSRKLKVNFRYPNATETNLRKVWRDAPGVPNWKPNISLERGILQYFEAR
jgi:nucleoside-diphosphate-sugar epimerase